MAGQLSYFELPVSDGERAKAFWTGLFGWSFEPGNFPGYDMITNASPLAGLSSADPEPGHPRVFFTVDDIHGGCDRVRELGGQADEPVQIPAGTFARCQDDQGTRFSLWQDPTGAGA